MNVREKMLQKNNKVYVKILNNKILLLFSKEMRLYVK